MKGLLLSNVVMARSMGRFGLMSVMQLVNKGAKVIFEETRACVEKNG
jgi:hypothetical protein